MSALAAAAGLEHLLATTASGVPVANQLLGLQMPLPDPGAWHPASPGARRDEQFGRLLAAQLGLPEADAARWEQSIAGMRDFVSSSAVLSSLQERILQLADAPDDRLLALASTAFEFAPVKFRFSDVTERYAYTKMGHAYWEYLTLGAFRAAGRRYFRALQHDPLYDASCFDEMLATALQPLLHRTFSGGSGTASLVQPNFTFGMSFGSGELPNAEEAVPPLIPVVHGAMLGALAYFAALAPAGRMLMADGSPAKALFWDDELGSFFDEVKRWSDVVVFIVPTHLQRIAIRGWSGEQVRCVLPETRVHELWSAVLPYCAGTLAPLVQSGRKVSVFIQAAATSVPISLLIGEMVRTQPQARVRSYDFGQVLDVAMYPEDGRAWSRRPDVWRQLAASPPMPLVA